MKNGRKYVMVLGSMVVVSIVGLLVVSLLTYLFKWQADKAMIGIIVTYILVGIAGGVTFGKLDKKEGILNEKKRGKKIIQAGILTSVYLIFLIVGSVFLFENTLEFSKQTLLIMFLELGSVYMGRILVK